MSKGGVVIKQGMPSGALGLNPKTAGIYHSDWYETAGPRPHEPFIHDEVRRRQ
jgi:hypothetical protein